MAQVPCDRRSAGRLRRGLERYAAQREKALPAHWNTPIYHRGHLYGSSGRHSGPAELRCIDWQTGAVKWRQAGLARASLLYVDDHFVCLSEDGTLRLIEANADEYSLRSQLDWGMRADLPQLEYPAWAAPVLARGLMYVRGKQQLICAELIP